MKRLLASLIAAVAAISFIPDARSQDEPAATVPGAEAAGEPKSRYSLFAGGDTMLGRWVHHSYYSRGGAWMFEAVRDHVRGADVALTNLECVVSSRGEMFDKGEGRPFLYRARPETLDILTEAGFDVVITANNHSLDYDTEALLEQHELLEAAGIAYAGTGSNAAEAASPAYVRVGEIILAIIGMDNTMASFRATDDRAGTFYTKPGRRLPPELAEAISTARRHADLVVFSPHWGRNWTENPSPERVALARAVIDAGVDAILGHSSHHLHGIEIYKGRPIVYDMGSLFFDTIRQKRMRLSAGFVLEFDKTGFRKLLIHPYYLSSSRVDLARGEHLERIHELMRRLTGELDEAVVFEREGDALVVNFAPEEPNPPRLADPPRIHEAGRTRRLPEEFRRRKTNVVVDEPPGWRAGFEPVKMDRGVTVLGHRHAEAVRPGRGFVSRVALRVGGPLEGRWESFIEGRRRGGGDEFTWRHPVADGGWQPEIWEAGQHVIDLTLVRPKKLTPGIYDLYWGFVDVRTRERAMPLEPPAHESGNGAPTFNPLAEGLVPVGSIYVLEKGIPRGPAGLAWDGLLPDSLKAKERPAVADGGPPAWALPAGVGALLGIALVFLFVLRRKRRTR